MTDLHVHFETNTARRAHESSDLAPEGYRWLVIAENAEGRPCGWGAARSFDAARAEADHQWTHHGCPGGAGCYPGEVRGPFAVHLIAENRDAP